MNNKSNTFKLSVFTLAVMNVAAVVSLRGLPAEAEYGISSAFYYLFAAVVFLIPTSMVAAELASLFSEKQGGVFRWVGEAFGSRLGFLAIWLQWLQNTIWYPTALTFGAVALAYIGSDKSFDSSLASNKLYTLIVVLIIYWSATFFALRGLKMAGKITQWGSMAGTIIPAAILIIFGIIYLASGNEIALTQNQYNFFPDFTNFSNLVLASSIFLFYAGMEMSGVHVKEMDNPARNYPKAIFTGSLMTVLIFVLGTYAISFILPQSDINLIQSLLVAFDRYFELYNLSFLSPVMAIALAFGVLAGVLSWVVGPSKGLFAVGKAGYLPKFFQKTNKNGTQLNILLIQGGIVTFLSILFIFMPSVQSFYQLLSQLTVILYLIMYLLMFSAAIYLRYSQRDGVRTFRIGKKGNIGIWIVSGLGFFGSLLALVLSFIPPSQITTGSSTTWFLVLFIGAIIAVLIPFLIYSLRKPEWKSTDPKDEFEPFNWETKLGKTTLS